MENSINVLLVDDSAVITERLKSMLYSMGIKNVEAVSTLPQAQNWLKFHKIDVIVLDIQLPDGNGIDFLKWTRFIYPKTQVILLSNLADDCHRAAAKNAGAYCFLDKSLEFDKLPKALEKAALLIAR